MPLQGNDLVWRTEVLIIVIITNTCIKAQRPDSAEQAEEFGSREAGETAQEIKAGMHVTGKFSGTRPQEQCYDRSTFVWTHARQNLKEVVGRPFDAVSRPFGSRSHMGEESVRDWRKILFPLAIAEFLLDKIGKLFRADAPKINFPNSWPQAGNLRGVETSRQDVFGVLPDSTSLCAFPFVIRPHLPRVVFGGEQNAVTGSILVHVIEMGIEVFAPQISLSVLVKEDTHASSAKHRSNLAYIGA